MIVLLGASLMLNVYKNAKENKGGRDLRSTFFAVGILIGLLIWGGFWG